MSETTTSEFEQWSPSGARSILLAKIGGAAVGVLLIAALLIIFGSAGRVRDIPGILCIIFCVIGAIAVALFILAVTVARRGRGTTIALLVLSLIVALPVAFYISALIYVLFTIPRVAREFHRLPIEAILFFIVVFLIPIAGYFTSWNCIQVLRRWPRRVGTAFQVELSIPPQDISEPGGTQSP